MHYRIPLKAQKAQALGPAPQGAPRGPDLPWLSTEKKGKRGQKKREKKEGGKKQEKRKVKERKKEGKRKKIKREERNEKGVGKGRKARS